MKKNVGIQTFKSRSQPQLADKSQYVNELTTINRRYLDNSIFMTAGATSQVSKLYSNYKGMCESGEVRHDDN